MNFEKGAKVQAVDELGRWEEARVCEVTDDGKHLVRFIGWSKQFDRVVGSDEIREIVDPFQISVLGTGRGIKREKNYCEDQFTLLKGLVQGDNVSFIDDTSSQLDGKVVTIDKYHKCIRVTVDGMTTRNVPIQFLLISSNTTMDGDGEEVPKKTKFGQKRKHRQRQPSLEPVEDGTSELETVETPSQEPAKPSTLPAVFCDGNLIYTGQTYSMKEHDIKVAVTEIEDNTSSCLLRGNLITDGRIDHEVKMEMPISRVKNAICSLPKKDRDFLGKFSIYNSDNQEVLRKSDISVRISLRRAQLSAALYKEVQCALKCKNFKRRFSLGLCSFEYDFVIFPVDICQRKCEISYRNGNLDILDSLLGKYWDVLPIEGHFRFVSRVIIKMKDMQIIGSIATAISRTQMEPNYRSIVLANELDINATEGSDLEEDDMVQLEMDAPQ